MAANSAIGEIYSIFSVDAAMSTWVFQIRTAPRMYRTRKISFTGASEEESSPGRFLPRLILVVLVFLEGFVAFIVYLADESVFTEFGYGVNAS